MELIEVTDQVLSRNDFSEGPVSSWIPLGIYRVAIHKSESWWNQTP